ncbi:hypothetical protein D3C85_1672640 [compost metagenome]
MLEQDINSGFQRRFLQKMDVITTRASLWAVEVKLLVLMLLQLRKLFSAGISSIVVICVMLGLTAPMVTETGQEIHR